MTRNIQTSNLLRSFGVQRNNQAIIAYSTPHFRTPQARAAFHTSRSPAFQLHRRILQASNFHHSSYFKSLVQAQTRMVGLQILSDIALPIHVLSLSSFLSFSFQAISTNMHGSQASSGKVTDWVHPNDKSGEFKRQVSSFRNWISRESGAKYPPEKGRYHLYVSYACPWVSSFFISLLFFPSGNLGCILTAHVGFRPVVH